MISSVALCIKQSFLTFEDKDKAQKSLLQKITLQLVLLKHIHCVAERRYFFLHICDYKLFDYQCIYCYVMPSCHRKK